MTPITCQTQSLPPLAPCLPNEYIIGRPENPSNQPPMIHTYQTLPPPQHSSTAFRYSYSPRLEDGNSSPETPVKLEFPEEESYRRDSRYSAESISSTEEAFGNSFSPANSLLHLQQSYQTNNGITINETREEFEDRLVKRQRNTESAQRYPTRSSNYA
jgi:hypothetical protein